MRLKELKDNRGALLKKADTILQNAGVEKRECTREENMTLGGIKSEIFQIDADIAKYERSLVPDRSYSRSGSFQEFNPYGHGDESALQVDTRSYSITRAMRGASIGRLDGYEAEMSQEIARRSGKPPDGFYLPHAVLIGPREQRAGMTVTGDSGAYGGNNVGTEIMGFIDALRPMLAVARMGATVMSGLSSNVGIPRHVAASTASWKSEVAAHDEQSQEIEQLQLTPKRIGAWSKFSKTLIAQSTPDVEAFVRQDLMAAIATGFDSAAINGTGADDQPRGILATSGIGSVAGGTNGLAPTWAHLVGLVAAVANVNAAGGRSGFLINTKTEAKLRSTIKVTDGELHILEEGQTSLVGNPWLASNNVPSNLTKGSASAICSAIIFGDWTQLILASFGDGVDMIVDPFTLATTSQTRVVVNALCDVGVRRAEAFSAMKDALTTL